MPSLRTLWVVLLAGCTTSYTTEDEGTDRDLGPIVASDSGPGDAGVVDTGPPVVDALREELRCRMDGDGARAAVLAHVACVDDRSTASGLVEGWEAGLFGLYERDIATWTTFPMDQGCDYWRCMEEAESCEDRARCITARLTPEPCTAGQRRCDGEMLEECVAEGDGFRDVFDCSVTGGGCADGQCEREGCSLGERSQSLACDEGAVTACEGAIRIDCASAVPGSQCTSFAIGGEVPTYYCGPGGFVAGAYASPVTCSEATGEIGFINQATQLDETIDCVAAGFDGCDQRGCLWR